MCVIPIGIDCLGLYAQTKDQSTRNAMLEGELEAVRQSKEKERVQLEAQLAQQKEESRRAQDKLQVENGVSSYSMYMYMYIPAGTLQKCSLRLSLGDARPAESSGGVQKEQGSVGEGGQTEGGRN